MVGKSKTFWHALAIGLLTTFTSFYLLETTSAGPQAGRKLTGDLWINGVVSLNGMAAKTGTTVFSGGHVKTTSNGVATINLIHLGRIRLEPGTDMVLRFSEGIIGGELNSGKAVVNASKGVRVSLATPSGMVEADEKQNAALQVTATDDSTSVHATSGEAKVILGNKSERVGTGEEVTVAKGGQGTKRRWLGAVAIAGSGAAIAIGALASESITAVVSNVSGKSPFGISSDPLASGLPSATPTPKPLTPVKPPPTVDVCGCKFNANTGNPLDPGQRVTICHVPSNDPTRRNTITVTCAALNGHFNLNSTPRTGHLCDLCRACGNYIPPATCPVR